MYNLILFFCRQSDLLFISQELDDIDNLLNVEQIIKGQTTI